MYCNKQQNYHRSLYRHSSVNDPGFTREQGQGELEAADSTVGGLTSRRQPEHRNKTKTTIIDISAGYSLIHSKYVQFNNLSFMQTLAPLSMFECWLVMNVNIALILVRAGLLNDCVETADESPQNHSGSGLGSSCLRKTKAASKKTVRSTVSDFQCKLLSVPRLQENVLGRIQSLRTRDTSIGVSQVLNITSRDRVTAALKLSALPQRLIKHRAANRTNPERQSRARLLYWPWICILHFSEQIHPDESER